MNLLQALFRLAYGAMYQAQVGHWHVTGPDFQEFHDMFAAEYTYWAAQVDVIAEHVRTRDGFMPTNLSELAAKLPHPNQTEAPLDLVQQYLTYVTSIRALAVKLDSASDSGIAEKDLAGELDRDMAKAQWKFKAVLRQG